MSHRRLAIVAPSRERGGAEEYLVTIAGAAARATWEVHAGLPRLPGTESIRRELFQCGVTVRALRIGDLHRPGKVGAARRIATDFLRTAVFLAQVRPAVVLIVLPHPEASPGALLATTALRLPALVVLQLVPDDMTVSARRRRLYALAHRRQRWVTVSDDNRRVLAHAFGFDPKRVLRIYNGIPASDPPSATERHEARDALSAELGLSDDAKVLLTVGRLSYQKGHDQILAAVPAIRARVPEAVFVWAGSGELERDLRRQIGDIGADDRVRLLGRRTDVR